MFCFRRGSALVQLSGEDGELVHNCGAVMPRVQVPRCRVMTAGARHMPGAWPGVSLTDRRISPAYSVTRVC